MDRQDGFDRLPLPGAEDKTDSTLFIDGPGKLPMKSVCMILVIFVLGQVPGAFTATFANSGFVTFIFACLVFLTAAAAIKLYFTALEQELLQAFVHMVVRSTEPVPLVGVCTVTFCLLLSISTVAFNWQIQLSSAFNFWSNTDLTVLYRFVAIVILLAFSIPFGYFWTPPRAEILCFVHSGVIVIYVVFVLIALIGYVLKSDDTVESAAHMAPTSVRAFSYLFSLPRLASIFPVVHYWASELKNGRKARCERANWIALGALAVLVTVIGLGESLLAMASGNVNIFESAQIPSRIAQIFAALSQVLVIPHFFPPLIDVTTAFFGKATPAIKEYQKIIVIVASCVVGTLLSLWNTGAKILDVLNCSIFIPLVCFTLPAILVHKYSSLLTLEVMDKVLIYLCYVCSGLQVVLGLFRFVCW